MKPKTPVEPEEWINPGERYCPECGGEVIADGWRDHYRCVSACGRHIGCGWGDHDRETPVKEGGEE